MSDLPTPTLLTVRQVAERLAVSQASVYRMADRGELERIRIGGGITRFDPRKVEELIEKSREAA